MKTISLVADIVLLAIDEETGKLRSLPDRALDYALAGALLAELSLQEKVHAEESGLTIDAAEPPEDPVLREVFTVLSRLEERDLRHALSRLAADGPDFRRRVVARLVEKGVLREEDEEFLWVFHRKRYPAADRGVEEAVRARLRRAILDDDHEPTRAELLLAGLVHACQLAYLVLSDEELAGNREHLQAMARSDAIGRAVYDTVQEIHRALLEIRTYTGM
ncbi:MAG: GPP34 family phosphoprotein [Opitutales bacterium]|nr:GPP34 family phosphoprotein [Opitutales bacterium]